MTTLRAAIITIASFALVLAGLLLTSPEAEPPIPRCTEAIAEAHGICQGVPTWEEP